MFEGLKDVAYVRPWVRDSGGDGEPLVLCHPRSQSSEDWVHECAPCAGAGFRVIAYSRRGVFRSDLGDPIDPGSEVGGPANLLEMLGVAGAHVLGAAAGGITAASFAVAQDPERTLSMVLAGSIVAPGEPDWRNFQDRLASRELEHIVPIEFLAFGSAYRPGSPCGTEEFARLAKMAAAIGESVVQPPGAHVSWSALEQLPLPVPTLLLTGNAHL